MEENKPFCGPHRILQTLNLLESIVFLTVSVPAAFLDTVWHDNREEMVVAFACNWTYAVIYYYIQYRDFAMAGKIFIHLLNVVLAIWTLVASVFACSRYMHAFTQIPHLEVLFVFVVLILGLAVHENIKQIVKGSAELLSLSCTVYIRHKSKNKNLSTPSEKQEALDILEKLENEV